MKIIVTGLDTSLLLDAERIGGLIHESDVIFPRHKMTVRENYVKIRNRENSALGSLVIDESEFVHIQII